ncbi:MAG: 23S rRNA (uracil(1939)-C(5))-methyltransferase RlmD [Oscillospiraceae bacterium]
MDNIKKNQSVWLEITGLTQEGMGVGRMDGIVVFVPMTAPGDRVRAKIVKVAKNHAYGIVEKLERPSADREKNRCPAFGRCGGCSLRHISYEAECREKEGFVRENLRRIGGIEPPLEPILPSPRQERYRNKAQFPVREENGRIRTGFFAPRSHRLIPVEDCLLQPEEFAGITRIFCDFMEEHGITAYEEETHTGLVRTLYLRKAEATSQLMVTVIVNGDTLPHWAELNERLREEFPGFATLVLDSNTSRTNVLTGGREKTLWGEGKITDVLAGVELSLSPASFYQVNREAAEKLYAQALEYAAPQGGEVLLDLYCGAGSIGLSMAHRVGEVIGVEVVEKAVQDARSNAERNGIANARFLRADAGEAARQLTAEGLTPDIVVLDPPRKGADLATIEAISAMSPGKIVYISCNSATLARDCKLLGERGYKAIKGRAVDLFPRTAHVEAVVLLSKSDR